MALPTINVKITNTIYGLPESGELIYQYSAFKNLQNSNTALVQKPLQSLKLMAKNAGININSPISLESEVSYDGSINLIITDNTNPPKIINSRFYQTDSTHYTIADRKGNLDTNIYSEANFKVETGLIKSVRTITTIDFLGLKNGGTMEVGNYTFYFKLADADGNESDFIAESGKIICHIGGVNDPTSIRGGQLNENSDKIIKLKLNNLDLAYDYINIYYTKSTGDGSTEITQTYRITDKFRITNNNTEISITGYENHEEISLADINIKYANFDSVKTLTNCQNISFAGHIMNDYSLFKTLEKYSLYVTPEIVYDTDGIGNLDESYKERYPIGGYEYYNINNIYYKLGYWDEEIYRFGIVYIMNDYTLSPVFNIRGKKIINGGETTFLQLPIRSKEINYGEDYIIEGSDPTNPENVKGVFKIDLGTNTILSGNASIKPIGVRFNFQTDFDNITSINILDNRIGNDGLRSITKGCFIVRQKRIPTILAQAIGIATATNGSIPVINGYSPYNINGLNGVYNTYFSESFLKIKGAINASPPTSGKPILHSSLFSLVARNNNALLCPEASVRREIFNSFFNSSEFTLQGAKYIPRNLIFTNNNSWFYNFTLSDFVIDVNKSVINTALTLIEPGISLIRNNKFNFCTLAGLEVDVSRHIDPVNGDFEDFENNVDFTIFNTTASKVRGYFNTFIGTESESIGHGRYYNIFQKDYDFTNYWKDYFRVRYNDSSPYFPVSDRISWDNVANKINNVFRGDCYINTFTQRMNWNFADESLPTNHRIVDPYTWYKNFRIDTRESVSVNDGITSPMTKLTYRKLLQLFTYKNVFEADYNGETSDTAVEGLIEPDGKKFKKYSEINGLFGASKINKPDVNAVGLGHWVTVKICSNVNLAMRDIDFSNPLEETVHKRKRGFYPYQSPDINCKIPESDVINQGVSKSLGDKYYFEVPDVPFIQTSFSNRIHYSNILQQSSFTNNNRIFESKNYQDYTMEYGALIKLVEWYGTLIAVMEHGVLMIPVNERAMMTNANGENVYINTDNVLPKNPKVLSNTFGSTWVDSIIKTPKFIYGIDTVGKKVWRTNGSQFELISDMKIQKFLNDNIHLKESDTDTTVGVNFIKSHYNAFKQDVIFTYRYNEKSWSLCWNEMLNKWITRYTWFPEFSENINNIFYTFANKIEHPDATNKLYKHGFAGNEEILGNIESTKWYDEQHPFEYEFVVGDTPGVQKIFNNLKIISNLAEPESFYYEIVGEGFNWNISKEIIMSFGILTSENMAKAKYKTYFVNNPNGEKKLPFIWVRDISDPLSINWPNPSPVGILKDLTLRKHNKTKENLVMLYQKGADIKYGKDPLDNLYGRRRGNMQYLEDSWDIQIQPINFKYAYLNKDGELAFTDVNEMKVRDKYIKIRVKYDGKQYAIINALKTLFTISYA